MKLRPQAETLSGSPQPNFVAYKPSAIVSKRSPTTSDTGYALGQDWINKVANTTWELASVAAGVATWVNTGSSGSDITSLTGDTGTATPTAGNIKIAGTALQIATAASGSTVTASVPATFSFGSSAAANSGTLLSGTGGFTFTSSNGNIAVNAGTGTIAVGSDATGGVLGFGTGAGAKLVTVGSNNGASSLNLNCGTGACNVGATATDHTTTVGTTTGAGATVIQSGTSGASINTGAVFSPTGIMTSTVQTFFRAFQSAPVTNVTGNGTNYFIIADTIITQRGTGYNSGTGVFTAPVAGVYSFSGQASVTGVTTGTGLLVTFVSSVNNYQGPSMNPSTVFPLSGLSRLNVPFCIDIPMVQGETIQLAVTGYGQGADSMGVFGDVVTLQNTFLSGYLLS